MVQTPAEKHLVDQIAETLKAKADDSFPPPRILNIGAGSSLAIENQLTQAGTRYICDRVDVENCAVDHPAVDRCWQCSVESMPAVPSDLYVAAFANFVLEHVRDITSAAAEIHRVLAPSGRFIASIPNPSSPLGVIAKGTPLWFHRLIRRAEAWETIYAFKSVRELCGVFESAGFHTAEVKHDPFVQCYLGTVPVLNLVARGYDNTVAALGIKTLMTHVCLVFDK